MHEFMKLLLDSLLTNGNRVPALVFFLFYLAIYIWLFRLARKQAEWAKQKEKKKESAELDDIHTCRIPCYGPAEPLGDDFFQLKSGEKLHIRRFPDEAFSKSEEKSEEA